MAWDGMDGAPAAGEPMVQGTKPDRVGDGILAARGGRRSAAPGWRSAAPACARDRASAARGRTTPHGAGDAVQAVPSVAGKDPSGADGAMVKGSSDGKGRKERKERVEVRNHGR